VRFVTCTSVEGTLHFGIFFSRNANRGEGYRGCIGNCETVRVDVVRDMMMVIIIIV